MSGWGDFFKDKYEQVLDESTGEYIMVDKSAPKYKLDAQGNVINPPPKEASGGGFVFGGTAAPAEATSKRSGDAAGVERGAKRRRTRDLRLTGDESGRLLVVGNGDCGQLGLGDGDDDVRDSYKPIPLPLLDAQRVASVVCGGLHTGALTLDGRCFTWGCNDDEVLGRPGEESLPMVVEGALHGKRVTMLSAGDSHMAALTSEGQVYTWGSYKDSNGFIGYVATEEECDESRGVYWDAEKRTSLSKLPNLVAKLPSIKHIASGADHTLAVSADGFEVFGWGCGEKGQLGRELAWEKKDKKKYLKPTVPVTLRLPDASGAGASAKGRLTRALNENFLAWLRAEVRAAPDASATIATIVEGCEEYLDHAANLESGAASGLDDRIRVASVHAGAYHSLLLTAHGNVYACGLNNMGQLGLGSLEPNHTGTPTLVRALEGKEVTGLAGGEHHSLALTEEGEVYAFGRGDNNQLGFADGTDQQLTPRKVEALAGIAIRKVAVQSNSNVAVAKTGDLYSWGFGEMGQLCNGKAGDEPAPALVEASGVAGMAVLDAASGGQHTCIVAMERPD